MSIWNFIKRIFNGRANTIPGDIPRDLSEALSWLENKLPEEEKKSIADGSINITEGHHTVGRWLRNKWRLGFEDSPLHQYFSRMGIKHCDDMSSIILEAFQCRLRGEEFSLADKVGYYRQWWRDQGVDPDTLQVKESLVRN